MKNKHIASIIRVLFLILFFALFFTENIKIWFMIFGSSLLLAVVFGRIFCGYVCPMNTLMIGTEKVSKRFGIQKHRAPEWLQSKKLPWLMIVFSFLIMTFSRKVLEIEFPLIIFFMIVSVVLTIFYKAEIFHNYLCPFGALQKVFGSKPYFSHSISEEDCRGCGLCEQVCPAAAIKIGDKKKAIIEEKYCHQCTKCKQVCPFNAIKYGK